MVQRINVVTSLMKIIKLGFHSLGRGDQDIVVRSSSYIMEQLRAEPV
jgi:hypothetical protein